MMTKSIGSGVKPLTPENSLSLKDSQKLRKVTQDFEAFFASMLLKSMRKTVVKSGFLSGGNGEDTYRELLDNEIAKESVRRGRGLGIAESLYKQLSQKYYHNNATEDTKKEGYPFIG